METFVAFLKGILPKVLHWVVQRFKIRSPIEWSAEQFVDDHWCVVFPGKRDALVDLEGRKVRGNDLHIKLLKLGAVDYGETRIRLRLRGKTEAPVLVKQIIAQAVKSAPIEGIKITYPTAGVSGSTLMFLDLDDDGNVLPLWAAVEEDFEVRRQGATPFFSRQQINLSQSEYETLIIVAKTCRYSVSWTLKIEYEVAGNCGCLEIDNAGLPFRTTGDPIDSYVEEFTWAWFDGHKLLPTSIFDVG